MTAQRISFQNSAPPSTRGAAGQSLSGKDAARWRQVLARDPKFDGHFFYAVKTTKIYCRPSCPSRRPARANVIFFPTAAAAEQAGFRACKRCTPNSHQTHLDPHQSAVARTAEYLASHSYERTTLVHLAREADLDRLTLLRAFRRVFGVTPSNFAKAQRLARFQDMLRPSGEPAHSDPKAKPPQTITDAIYEAGFGSSSRLYESSRGHLGMKPRSIRAGGAGQTIRYTTAHTPLGRMLVAATPVGVCTIAFGTADLELLDHLRQRFPKADLRNDDQSSPWLAEAVGFVASQLTEHPVAANFPLDIRATAFQQRVWEALQQIPRGQTRSYSDLARDIGNPKASRAVGAAVGANPVAVVLPCHRVVGQNGTLTGYRWGVERKRILLQAEQAIRGCDKA